MRPAVVVPTRVSVGLAPVNRCGVRLAEVGRPRTTVMPAVTVRHRDRLALLAGSTIYVGFKSVFTRRGEDEGHGGRCATWRVLA